MIKNLYRSRYLIWQMAISQLKVKYSGSVLGISWAIVNPVLMMMAIVFVFTMVIKLEIENFPFFALSAIFPWMFFSNALSEATTSIVHQQQTLHQYNLNRESIPLSSALSNFMNFLIGWLFVFPLFVLLNWKILFLLPYLLMVILLHFLFVCGLSLAFSVINVLYRDLGHLLGVLLMLWFWMTPIFYSKDMIPLNFQWVFYINPMSFFVVFYRDIVFRAQIPHLSILVGAILWTIIGLVGGVLTFFKFNGDVIKRL